MSTPRGPSDESLRKLLRKMEDEREKQAPSFQRVWHRAQRATGQGNEPRRPAWWLLWTAAGATCAALLLIFALRAPHTPAPAPTRPDLAAAISSTQQAIARMPDPPLASISALPEWMSPTASLLDAPSFAP